MAGILEDLANQRPRNILGGDIRQYANQNFSPSVAQQNVQAPRRSAGGITGPAIINPAGVTQLGNILGGQQQQGGYDYDLSGILGDGSRSSTYPMIDIPQLDFGSLFGALDEWGNMIPDLFAMPDWGDMSWGGDYGAPVSGGGGGGQPQQQQSNMRFMDQQTGSTVQMVPNSVQAESRGGIFRGREFQTAQFDIPDPYNTGRTVRVKGTWDGSGWSLDTSGLPGASEMVRRVLPTDSLEPDTTPANRANIGGKNYFAQPGGSTQRGGSGGFQVTGQQTSMRWKPSSEKDGRLWVGNPRGASSFTIVDANGNVVERGRPDPRAAATNGYGSSARFSRPGSAYSGMYLVIDGQAYAIGQGGVSRTSLSTATQGRIGRPANVPSAPISSYMGGGSPIGRVASYEQWKGSAPGRVDRAGYQRYLKNMGVSQSRSQPSSSSSRKPLSTPSRPTPKKTSVGRVASYSQWKGSAPGRNDQAGYQRYLKNMGAI